MTTAIYRESAVDERHMSGLQQAKGSEYVDPVIELYKKDIDRTLLRENLKISVEERFQKFEQFMEYVHELSEAGRWARHAAFEGET
jgi:hypothetical protein